MKAETETGIELTQTLSPLANVFGQRPRDGAIFNPNPAISIRLDCRSGAIVNGDEIVAQTAEIAILNVARYFGDLGQTKGAEWLRIFFVAGPKDKALPQDTVMTSYIKTRSLGGFQRLITNLLSKNINPALGVFEISFNAHQTGDKAYKSVAFKHRDRTDDELAQLQIISDFMGTNPRLVDVRPGLQCIDSMSPEEIEFLVSGSTPNQPALAAGK
jgi:hypothetical protein